MESPARRLTPKSLVLAGILALATVEALLPWRLAGKVQPTSPAQPLVKVISSPDQTLNLQYRRALVGPGLNQPKPYPGYEGFVGWAGVVRTKTGALLVTFSSGYWHGSPPTAPQPLSAEFAEVFKKLSGVDISTINAPRGGRAEIIRSDDGGLTWSSPEVMIDTPWDDRSPSATCLSDGTLVASFFTYDGSVARVGIIRSFDDGKTWEQTPHFLDDPFKDVGTNGPPLELPDKSIILAVYGGKDTVKNLPSRSVLFRSNDRGNTWKSSGDY